MAAARAAASDAEAAAAASAADAARTAADRLRSALGTSPPACAADAERALLLGAIAAALFDADGPLAAAVGPRAGWPTARGGRASRPRSGDGAVASPDTPAHPALAALVAVDTDASTAWAVWAAAALGGGLRSALSRDPALSSRAPRAPAAATLPGGTTHSLPSCPSPGTALFLVAAAREAARAAGPRAAAPRAAPRAALAAMLADAAAAAFTAAGAGSTVTDAGTLQLLFDARATERALGAGRPRARARTRRPRGR